MIDNHALVLASVLTNYLMITLSDGTVLDGNTVFLGIFAGLSFIATIAYILYFGYETHPIILCIFAALIFIALTANVLLSGYD